MKLALRQIHTAKTCSRLSHPSGHFDNFWNSARLNGGSDVKIEQLTYI